MSAGAHHILSQVDPEGPVLPTTEVGAAVDDDKPGAEVSTPAETNGNTNGLHVPGDLEIDSPTLEGSHDTNSTEYASTASQEEPVTPSVAEAHSNGIHAPIVTSPIKPSAELYPNGKIKESQHQLKPTTNGNHPPTPPASTEPYTLLERSIDDYRPIKVIVIGCGFSGIIAGIRFPKLVPNLELVIYEAQDDVGGTW